MTNQEVKTVKSLRSPGFIMGLLVILACSYLQYVIQGLDTVLGTLLVYGVPIIVVSLIWGRSIVSKALQHMWTALKYGLGYFGIFTILGVALGILIVIILTFLDPSALNLLNRPNPVLQVSPQLAWIMVGFSLLVVGPSEEYLFRGFVFGGLLSSLKGRHWLVVALISSIFFAGVHLYYAVVYGLASLVQFVDLVTFGMAMAGTYYVSGGNLVIPALIHGTYDATAYIDVATSTDIGVGLRELMLFIGVVAAIFVFSRRKRAALR